MRFSPRCNRLREPETLAQRGIPVGVCFRPGAQAVEFGNFLRSPEQWLRSETQATQSQNGHAVREQLQFLHTPIVVSLLSLLVFGPNVLVAGLVRDRRLQFLA